MAGFIVLLALYIWLCIAVPIIGIVTLALLALMIVMLILYAIIEAAKYIYTNTPLNRVKMYHIVLAVILVSILDIMVNK